MISSLEILPFDEECSARAAEIYSLLHRKGRMIGEFDLLIAATCMAASETLLTSDRSFLSIPGLDVKTF